MKLYETGLIYNPQIDEAEFDNEIKRVTDIIESNSGKIEKVDRWGIRKLAYHIKKKSQGYYAFVYYEAPPQVPAQIESMLRINENCLRYMTTVPDFRPDFEALDSRRRPSGPYENPRERHREEPPARKFNRGDVNNDQENEEDN